MAGKIGISFESVFQHPFHQRLPVRHGYQTFAQVTGGNNAKFFPQPAGRTAVISYRYHSGTVAADIFQAPQQRRKPCTSAYCRNNRTIAQLTLGKNGFHQRSAALRADHFHYRPDDTPNRVDHDTDSQQHTGNPDSQGDPIPIFSCSQVADAEQNFFRHSHNLVIKQHCQGKRADDASRHKQQQPPFQLHSRTKPANPSHSAKPLAQISSIRACDYTPQCPQRSASFTSILSLHPRPV